MDENQIYNEERDEGGNEPMTLEEAFAMAQNRLGENASETPTEAVETSSASEGTNTTETPENTPTSPAEPHSEAETTPTTSPSEDRKSVV